MGLDQEIIKRIYCLDKIQLIKQEDASWIVRANFSLRREPDEVKRFILLKRFAPALSYFQFKEISFLREITYIDLRLQKLAPHDFDRVKSLLWDKLGLYLSLKLRKLLLPPVLV